MKTFFGLVFWVFSGVVLGQVPRLVVPIGHTKDVTSVAFSPNEEYILTGSHDKTAKLWDFLGRQIQSFEGHSGGVTSVAFSPNGKYILTGSGDTTAKLWDLLGHQIKSFKGHNDNVNSVAFSSNGQYILTGSWDKTVKLWDFQGRIIQSFEGEEALFSPDGKYILVISGEIIKIWDLFGNEKKRFKGDRATFSPDGKNVLVIDHETAILWDLLGREIKIFNGEAVGFSANGKYVLTINNELVKLWDISGKEIGNFTKPAERIEFCIISENGRYAIAGTSTWSNSNTQLCDLQEHTSQAFEGKKAIFSPNEKYILTINTETVELWDVKGKKSQDLQGHASWINSVAISRDGNYLLTGNTDHNAKIWELNGKKIQNLKGHTESVGSVAFSPDGQYILTGSQDYSAKLWNLSGENLQTFSKFSKSQLSTHVFKDIVTEPVAFSSDGKYVLIGRRLLDLNGELIKTFIEQNFTEFFKSAIVTSVAFSPDGKYILTSSGLPFISENVLSNTAKLWDLNGNKIQDFKGHLLGVSSVSFSPDGRFILTGSWDKTAKLWDLKGHIVQDLKGHISGVLSVAFSPDGKYILTGSQDKTAKLWDLKGNIIKTFSSHAFEVNSAIFSPNGNYIITVSNDDMIKLWDINSGKELATLVTIDATDWIVTTPSGLFDASPNAMKLMHYVIGLEVIDLEQLKDRYYEPGLLAKIMGFDKSELRNVATFDQVALYPEIKANIEKQQLTIQLIERNGGLGKLSLFINDKEVQEDINPKRLKNLSIDLKTFAKYYLPDTVNTIALRAYNQEGWLKSQAYEIAYRPAIALGKKTIPSLYALTIGTSQYAGDHHLNLSFADLDAEALAKAVSATGSALFTPDGTHVRTLTSSSKTPADVCTKTNIQQAFADVAAKAKPEDIVLIFFSGHGLAYGPAEKEQFYYLTKDIGSEKLDDESIRKAYAISSEELTQWLTDIPAQKQVMIIDACNAGKVVESLAAVVSKDLNPSQIRALERMKDRTGMFILTGSAKDKVSYEASQYGQGLLTYSLLQGMSGLALKEGNVDVMTLFQYACDKVPQLAKGVGGIQTPVLAVPFGGASFDIGVGTGVKIFVATEKPMFMRSNFQDENFGDALGLVQALEDRFRQLTIKGAQAELIYADVNDSENAYSIRGNYTISGSAVKVTGHLFKGKTPLGQKFQVTGTKSDVPGLVEMILTRIKPLAK